MRAFLAFLLTGAFLLPTVGAQEPVTAHDEEVQECRGHLYPAVPTPARCWMFAESNWTVEGCDASTCTVRMDARLRAGAVHPGLFHLEILAYPGNSGSACIGPKPVSDLHEDLFPCGRVCQTYRVSWTASCTGTKTATLEVAPGECMGFHVAHIFLYDEYIPAVASVQGVMMFNDLCRDAEGTPRFYLSPRSPD